MQDADISTSLQEKVQQALEARTPLLIQGGGSKDFLSRPGTAQPLAVCAHRGVIRYDPRELVVTARAGTTLSAIEATLAESGQMLPFEPPHFGDSATLGGTLACGLSGPRRPYAGSARDHTLGCRIINGRGEILQFGGQVMKNVAGYDLSRLMAGAHGTLGVLLDISLKVLPRPAASITLSHPCTPGEAITFMSGLLTKPYPVDAACHDGERCHIRLSGSEQAVREARTRLPGDALTEAERFWRELREQRLAFFTPGAALYRVMVKPATPHLALPGKWLLDWGGAQRWLISEQPLNIIREHAARSGGHVTQFRGGDRNGAVYAPLPPALLQLHQRLKHSFDPHGLLNPGRMYPEF